MKFKVVAAKAKIEQSAKTVTLYKNSAFNEVIITLDTPQGTPETAKVELKNAQNATMYYELQLLGGGQYLLKFKDAANAKSATLALNVMLEGNTKPSASVTMIVNAKQFEVTLTGLSRPRRQIHAGGACFYRPPVSNLPCTRAIFWWV